MFSRLFAKGYCTNLSKVLYSEGKPPGSITEAEANGNVAIFCYENLNQQMRGRFLYIQFSNAINHGGPYIRHVLYV